MRDASDKGTESNDEIRCRNTTGHDHDAGVRDWQRRSPAADNHADKPVRRRRGPTNFTIESTWRNAAEIEYRVVGRTADEGDDFSRESGEACHLPNPNTTEPEHYCDNGAQRTPYRVWVFHYSDDAANEGDETYTVEAWITRYATGPPDPRPSSPNGANARADAPRASDGNHHRQHRAGGTRDDKRPRELHDGDRVRGRGGSLSLTIQYTPEPETSHLAASVDWSTSDDDAIAGRDYNAASGTVRFSACATACSTQTRSIRISTREDVVRERDEEFLVSLSNPVNAEMQRQDSEWVLVTIVDDEENGAPRIKLTASRTRVPAGGTAVLLADGSDDEGNIASYEWSGAGRFSGTDALGDWERKWTAPRPHSESQYTLTVTVTDDEGATASDSVTMTVEGAPVDPENERPTVTLTASQTAVSTGGAVTLTASARDPDGSISSYTWSGEGLSSETSRVVQWTGPNVTASTEYVLKVTVTDDDGATASDSVSVRVDPNRAPTVTLTADNYAPARGSTVRLTAAGRDSDGNIASHTWSGEGLSGETAAAVDWTAPEPDETTEYTLTVTVTDDDGATGTDSVKVRVEGPDNQAPSVGGIGVSRCLNEGIILPGTDCNLTAAVSDADGSVAAASWSGEGRFSNTGISGGTAEATWRPPNVRVARNTTVTLVVTDNDGATTEKSQTWELDGHSSCGNTGCKPPTVDAGADRTVDGGATVDLTVTSSRASSFEWSGTGGTFGTVGSDGAVTWTAPSPRTQTDYTLTVTAIGSGSTPQKGTDDIVITVNASANRSPTVSLAASKTNPMGGETITLTATADDPDGTIASYAWSGDGIRNTGTPGSAEWTAPNDETARTR